MHKSLLLLLPALGLTVPALAQTERGAKMLGVSVGDVHYTRFQERNKREFGLLLTPSVGWFVADRFAVGTGIVLGYNKTTSKLVTTNSSTETNNRTLAVGLAPFARYYFIDGSKHKLFGQLSTDVTRYMDRSHYVIDGVPSSSRSHDTGGGLAVALGYNYFLTSNVALEAAAGYRRDFSNYYSLAQGSLNVQFGLNVFLPPGGTTTAN